MCDVNTEWAVFIKAQHILHFTKHYERLLQLYNEHQRNIMFFFNHLTTNYNFKHFNSCPNSYNSLWTVYTHILTINKV